MANEINIVVSAQVGDATKGLTQVQKSLSKVPAELTKVQARINDMVGANERMVKSVKSSASAFQDFDRAKNEVDKLRSSLDPAYAATLRYEKAVESLDQALEMGVISQMEYNTTISQLKASSAIAVRGIDRTAKSLRATQNQFNSTAVATNKWAKGALQQAGYQVGDFAVQIGGGQNAMQAFAQQGSQLAGIFGPMGAVIGAAIAIFGGIAAASQRASKAADETTESIVSLSSAFSKLERIDAIKAAENLSAPAQAAAKEYSVLLDAMQAVAMEERASAISDILSDIAPLDAISELQSQLEAIKPTKDLLVYQSQFMDTSEGLKKLTAEQERLVSAIDSEAELRGIILSTQGKTREEAARNLQDAIASLKAMGRLTPELRSQLIAYGEQAGLLSTIESTVEGVSESTEEAAEQSKKFADDMQRAANAVMGINTTAFSKLQQLQAELRGRTRGLGDNEIRVMQAARAAEMAAKEAGVDSALELAAISSEAARIERQIIAAEEGLAGFNTTASTSTAAVKKIANTVSVELTPAMKRAAAVGDMVGNSMETAMMSIVDGTKSVKDAFKSMASEIIKELYRIFVVKKITGLISGFIADPAMFGGLGGTSPVNGSVMPTMRPSGVRAMGGQVTGNKAYMVGERGPEMIVPSRNSHVVPNNQMGGGGVTVVQNINVSTGVQQTVRTEIKTLMPQIADAAKAAVADAKLRGGSYGRSFA